MPYIPDIDKFEERLQKRTEQTLKEWQTKKAEEEYQRALEEDARRRAEEWISERPWWQKAIDVVLPGAQFRTPSPEILSAPAPTPEVAPPRLSVPSLVMPVEPVPEEVQFEPPPEGRSPLERLGRILQIGAGAVTKGLTFGLGGPGGLIERGVFKLTGAEPPPAPVPETTAEKIAAGVGELAGSLVPGAVGARAAATLAPRLARPAVEAAERAVEAFRTLPKPARTIAGIAGGIGAGATAEEMIRGAISPEAKEQTLPARFGASLRAGFGDVLGLAGSVAKILKQESVGEKLRRVGEAVRAGFETEPVEFSWKSFFDPDWYAVNVARSVPLTLSLIPAMYLGYKTGGKLGAKIGLGPFGRAILGSLVGAAASRPLESAFEAAGAYEDYLAKNPGDVEGAERAANRVFWNNMKLMGLDAFELAAAFAPVPTKPISRLSNALLRTAGPRMTMVLRGAARAVGTAAPEAIEEGLQEAIQRQALGEPVTFDSKLAEAMAIGGLFGAGMGGVGHIVEHIREKTLEKLPPALRTDIIKKAAKAQKTERLPIERAWEHAFDEVLSDKKKAPAVRSAIDEAVSELDAMLDEATAAHMRPELAEHAARLAQDTTPPPIVRMPAPREERERPKLTTLADLDEATTGILRGVAKTMSPERARTYIRDFFVEQYDVTPARAAELAESLLERERIVGRPAVTERPAEEIKSVSPKAGGIYRARITKSTGKLKVGQEFVGKVNRIFRVKSGAVLAELETPEGQKVNIPVSKYAEWYPVERIEHPVKPEATPKAEPETAKETTPPKFSPGDRVAWRNAMGETFIGTVKGMVPEGITPTDMLQVETEVPARQTMLVDPNNPTLELLPKEEKVTIEAGKEGGEDVRAPERRGVAGRTEGAPVEERGEGVLGEVAPELERPTEERKEVREHVEPVRPERAEDVGPGVHRPVRKARGKRREGLPGEGRKDEGRRLHGPRASEGDVAVSAAREGGAAARPRNYVITDPEKLEEGGVVTKARRNLEALKLLKKLEEEGRTVTPEEQEVLAGYTGWGAAWQVFEPWRHPEQRESLYEIYDELNNILTPQEFAIAQRSTQYAHYTAPAVVQAMWRMAERFGFEGGRVLEPALGTGYFFGLMPPKLNRKSKLVGVEIEPIAGKIAQHLYPEAKVFIQGFEETSLPDNFFDLAISNVPFGDILVNDPNYPKYLRDKLHNYFFVKALDKVRPGGLVMFISSTGVMDARGNQIVRKHLADKADLVAAIRLPGQTHKKVAQTEVTTDIVILRKRLPGEKPKGESWIESKASGLTGKDGSPLYINEYFIRHPEMVIGKLTEDKLHPGRIGVDGTGIDVAEALNTLIEKLPRDIMRPEEPKPEELLVDIVEGRPTIADGSVVVRDDKVYRAEEGRLIEITGKAAAKVKALAGVRDAALEVLSIQYREGSDEELKAAQEKLNRLYDVFVKKYGPIHQNLNEFQSDPYTHVLSALEIPEYEKKGTKKVLKGVTKADIFAKRTVRGYTRLSKVDSPVEALIVSLAERGKVDMARMSELTGKTEEELARELKDRIFKNPETQEWETAEQYLSGNVRAKLKAAQVAAELDPAYRDNVEALEKVQPPDIPPHEISVVPGAPWIPAVFYRDFLAQLINARRDLVSVRKAPTGTWIVKVDDNYARRAANNTSIFGTPQNPAHELFEQLLNKQLPVETKVVFYGDQERKITDLERTRLARKKQEEILKRFTEWLWSDPVRAEQLARTYNDIYNNLRLPYYDGSHLTFPGLAATVKPWPHQKNAVWRILTSPTGVLIGHGVGKGKTLTLAMTVMELRRLGMARKPMIVVPVNLKEQWQSLFKQYYPGAKLLVLDTTELPGLFPEKPKEGESPEEFEKRKKEHLHRRKTALMRIATGDWDAVLITDLAFERLPVSASLEQEYIERELALLRHHLQSERMVSREKRTKTIKQIEQAIQKLEAHLKEVLEKRSPDKLVMPFEELGVDWLLVDEAHRYKRLKVVTKMDKVAGVPKGESRRALDMYLKTQYILGLNNGRGVVFATGTPITNTMAELFNLKRYLAPNILRGINAEFFDDWASAFTRIGEVFEYNPATGGYQAKTALQKYVNLPELLKFYHSFGDILPNRPDDSGVPRLKGGKRIHVVTEPSETQLNYFAECLKRLEAIKAREVDPKDDNALKVYSDGQKMSIDPRLIDPSLPDEPESRLNKAIAKIYEIWERTKDKRSTQLVFLDISIPKREEEVTKAEDEEEAPVEEKKENISLYLDLKRKLVMRGIPAEEIAFIHEAKTQPQKEDLMRRFNNGEIRILVGSTGKMGIGMNLQKKLIALHHVDVPWRPDEVEQREGRILRPGNENEEVEIYVYGTRRSFDIHRWNKVIYKASFISQTLSKNTTMREVDAPDDVVLLSYEEARAAYADNPMLEEKAKVDAEIARLRSLKQGYADSVLHMRRQIDHLEKENERLTDLLERLEEDRKRRKDVSGDKFTITIEGQTYTNRQEAAKALAQIAARIPAPKAEHWNVKEVGEFAGFKLYVRKHTLGAVEWELKGAASYSGALTEGVFRSMETTLKRIDKRISDVEKAIEEQAQEIARLREAIEKPFPEEKRLQELLVRQREIDAQLGLGPGERLAEEGVEPDKDGIYPLPELEKLRGKADVVLTGRVKGVPKEDTYALPLYAPQKTSVKQVARGLRMAVERGIFKKGMVVADVGGGLYDNGTRYLAEHGITNLVYDPYARTEEHNETVLRTLYERGGADAVALNNVLNVIPETEERADVLRFSYGLLKNGGQMVITVYEGNKSGKGSMKEFKDGTYTWQENRPLDSYEQEIRKALPDAQIEKKYGAFIIAKPQQEKKYEFYALAKPKPTAQVVRVEEPNKLSPRAARKIAEKLTEVLNTAVMATRPTGVLKGKRAVYEVKPHAIRARKKYMSHWRTVGHELGHAFKQYTDFKPNAREMAVVINELYPGGLPGVKDIDHEGFAEFLMLYFADNARARQLAPKTYDEFERFLLANPELKQTVDEARAIAKEDLEGTPLARAGLYVASRTENPTAIGAYRVPWWKRPTFSFLDGSIPLKALYEEAVKRGYAGLDPAKLYAASGMAWDKAVEIFKSGVVYQQGGRITPGKRSLASILKEAEQIPDGLVLLDRILRAFHSIERQDRGIETALPRELAEEIVKEAKKKYPELVKLAKEYSETLSETCLRMLVDGKVISPETAKRVGSAYEWYMPLYVRRPAFRVRREPLRESGPGVIRARGHTQEELPLIEATLMKLQDAAQAVELNKMMQTIEESLKLPNMGVFGIIVEKPVVAKKMRLGTVVEQVERFLGEEIDVDDPARIITLFMPGFAGDLRRTEPIIVARHGDKETYMQLAPDLFEAVQSLRPITYNMVVKVLSFIGSYGRLGALANIRFVTNNMARDIMASAIQSKTTFERSMVAGYLKGALTAAGFGEKADEIMNLYIQSGAYGSAPQEVLRSLMRSAYSDGLLSTPVPGWKRTTTGLLLRIINTPLDVLRIQEEAPRVSEFVAVLQKELKPFGLTMDDVIQGNVPEELRRQVERALLEAAYASREVVINFGLHGVSQGWRTYVRTVPFLHGSLQGIYRSYRMIKDHPGEALKRWLVYVLPITLLAWALSHRDDKYRDLPSEARDRYWWFPVGHNLYYAVAKPYEYALPANLLERMLDWLADSEDSNRRKPLDDFAEAIWQAYKVDLMPMVVSTIWDIARNRDAFGAPIEPMREQNIPPEYRYGPGTTQSARMLATIAARFMGDHAPSPRQIDYFMRGVFGGFGTTAMRLLSGRPFGTDRAGTEYMPVIGPLLYGPMESGSRVVDRFYKDYDRAQKLYNAYRLHGRQPSEYEARLIAAIPAMRAIANDLADLRRELRKIEMDPKASPERKRLAALRFNWIERVATGYLYGAPVPVAPPETGFTEAHAQDLLRYYDALTEQAIERAKKRQGGPV